VKYGLVYTKRAAKDVSGLDHAARERIRGTLERYAQSPFSYAKKMVNPVLGAYRFRIGEYRVIFDVEGNKIVVLRVGHRREIYRG
jgi:mRNA interferase RelE/StbE